MVVYYVIWIFYNFLIGGKNSTHAASVWTNGELNDSSVSERNGETLRPTSSVTVFKNYAAAQRKVPDEAELNRWTVLAQQHLNSMSSDSVRCATPRPKVMKVQELHSHASKRFLPSCVTLHRCDHRTGCCDDEDNVCTATRKHKVPMYFFVVNLIPGNADSSVHTDLSVERLYFSNHTECGCRRRKIRTTPSPPSIGQIASGVDNNQLSTYLAFIVIVACTANKFVLS